MTMDRKLYPDDWERISLEARQRADWRCERCGVPNGIEIVRSDIDGAQYIVWHDDMGGYRFPSGSPIRLSEIPGEYDISKQHTRIVLTVHHVGIERPDGSPGDPHDKSDCRPENLQALCQRCHLLADMPSNKAKAHITRLNKKHAAKVATGQGELF